MLESITAESSNELTGMAIPKEVHKQGLNPACGLFLSSQSLKAMGPQKGRTMESGLAGNISQPFPFL
jgi:hypothetical protein